MGYLSLFFSFSAALPKILVFYYWKTILAVVWLRICFTGEVISFGARQLLPYIVNVKLWRLR